jgi:hypothetical protein
MPNVPFESQKPYENRFAEVTRKSREARARLKENSDIRAIAEERRIIEARMEAAERDRQLDRQASARAAVQAEQETARGTSASSAMEKASAQLGGEANRADRANGADKA